MFHCFHLHCLMIYNLNVFSMSCMLAFQGRKVMLNHANIYNVYIYNGGCSSFKAVVRAQ